MDQSLPTLPSAAAGSDAEMFLEGIPRLSLDNGGQNPDDDHINFAWKDPLATKHQCGVHGLSHTAVWLLRQSFSPMILLQILPSFVIKLLDKKPHIKKAPSGKSISALDGLRGLSCLMVMHMHWSYAVTDSYRGGSSTTNIQYLFHRPFFQLLWAGGSHVNIFFVMSGYVLSLKCLNTIHRGSSAYNAMASAVFRRAIRIFLPPLVILFIYLIAIRAHIFDKSYLIWKENRDSHQYQLAFFESPPPILPTFSEQLWDILGSAGQLMDPNTYFNGSNYGNYDSHLWTMPKEFYCSMTLYIILLGTSRLWTRHRLLIHSSLVTYCWLSGQQQQHHGLFFAGMTIAEFDILLAKRRDRSQQTLDSLDSATTSNITTTARSPFQFLLPYLILPNLISTAAFVSGLYLLSLPLLYGEHTPGFETLISLLPAYMDIGHRCDALRSLGAVLVVWPITYSSITGSTTSPRRLIQLVFANPVSAYLGQISFAFYLVHGFVIRSLGYTILPSIYTLVVSSPERRGLLAAEQISSGDWIEARDHLTATEVGAIWILGYLIVLPACIWMSDLFWRLVDVRSVNLGRWLEEKMFMKEDDSENSEMRVEKIF